MLQMPLEVFRVLSQLLQIKDLFSCVKDLAKAIKPLPISFLELVSTSPSNWSTQLQELSSFIGRQILDNKQDKNVSN